MNPHIPLGRFDIVSFTGQDAVRFLNGQLTQDVRKVEDRKRAAFSCVTDAKGRLQFRIVITADDRGTILAAIPTGHGEALEARLTRYLIADDAEAVTTEGAIEIHHFVGAPPSPPAGVLAREIERFGEPGCDWWMPAGLSVDIPRGFETCTSDDTENLRVARGVPAWGLEITEGMLPPEARLEASDISYQKGCYIGQEVISRIKSAGKVNRLLTRFEFDGPSASPGPLIDPDGKEVGLVTSIAPAGRAALGFLKRNTTVDGLHLGGVPIRHARQVKD